MSTKLSRIQKWLSSFGKTSRTVFSPVQRNQALPLLQLEPLEERALATAVAWGAGLSPLPSMVAGEGMVRQVQATAAGDFLSPVQSTWNGSARTLAGTTQVKLAGTWWYDSSHVLTVTQTGSLLGINQGNQRYTGRILSNGQVSIDGTSRIGVLVDNGTRVLWNNDTLWKKTGAAADWYDNNLPDWNLRSMVHVRVAADGRLDRNDLIALFRITEKDGVLNANEMSSLKTVLANAAAFQISDSVKVLSNKIVYGDPANAHYQGGYLGNLRVGSTSNQLEKLIGKWFLGLDHPASRYTYQFTLGSLINGDHHYWDVQQGQLGNCYFLATLAEIALQKPQYLDTMFVDNGDNTFTVRFFHNGCPDYVTVDRYLPTQNGRLVYDGVGAPANNPKNVLWVALAEKAYAQLNESGWLERPNGTNGLNSYDAIEGGFMSKPEAQLTGIPSVDLPVNYTNIFYSYTHGGLVVLGSKSSGVDCRIAQSHAYAVVGYSPINGTVTLFNPWGSNGGYGQDGYFKPGFLTLSIGSLYANFGMSSHSYYSPLQANLNAPADSATGSTLAWVLTTSDTGNGLSLSDQQRGFVEHQRQGCFMYRETTPTDQPSQQVKTCQEIDTFFSRRNLSVCRNDAWIEVDSGELRLSI